MKRSATMMALCVAVVGAVRAAAQTTAASEGPKETTLAIAPAAMESPALQFQLLPPEQNVEPGNGVPRYLSALTLLPKTANEDDEQINKWLKGPLAAIDEAAAQQKLAGAVPVLTLAAAGARTEHANWEIDLRREGFRTLLPHLHPLRLVANLLALSIRLDIKHHRWTDARDKLQTGFAMARHMGEGDTLIESLVAILMATRMEACVEDWVQEPGSPNLFWPLCNVPMPFNTLRHATAMERAGAYFEIPVMRDFAAGRYSVEGWYALVKGQQEVNGQRQGETTWLEKPFGLVMALADYPQAKAALIARGAAAEEVEQRPVAEVLEEFFMLRFAEHADDISKWSGLPAYQVTAAWESGQAEGKWASEPPRSFADILCRVMIPSLSGAQFRTSRLDRQMAMLRIVEAVRAYTAEKGALPESLDAVRVPLPAMDPATGKPFSYVRDGEGATLASPAMKDRTREDVWHVTLRR